MHSVFENRVWLSWLVRVRILILTIILGIELAIAQFTTVAFPIRLFVGTILLAYGVSFLYLALLKIGNKLQLQSALQVISDLLFVSLFLLGITPWPFPACSVYPFRYKIAPSKHS